MSRGSVAASMIVYNVFEKIIYLFIFSYFMQDFYYYSSGIYVPTNTSSSNVAGWHEVRIFGWGVGLDASNNSQEYWLAANSWNTVHSFII